jgi:hypothetical protein
MPRIVTVTTSTPAAKVVVTEPAPVVRIDAFAPAPETISVTEVEKVVIDHPGTQGLPGPSGGPGESAYQLALDSGFVGTEAQWLASLIGPAGPAGPAGSTAALAGTYIHDQVTPSDTWVVTHWLGFNPNVTTVDSANTRIEGELFYLDLNSLELQFSVPIGGRAYLS